MAHLLDHSRGRTALYLNGKPGWHGLGQVTLDAKTSADAMKLAELDWEVHQHSLVSFPEGEEAGSKAQRVEGWVHNVRADTNGSLGIVSADYRVLQNREAFEWCDGLVADKKITYESAGAVKGGRVVWVLAHLKGSDFDIRKGDQQKPYMLITMAHDGTRGIRILPTSIRVVCWNTLSLALAEEAGLCIRHTGDMEKKLEQARIAYGQVENLMGKYAEHARAMTKYEMKGNRMADYLATMLPTKDEDTGEEIKVNQGRQVQITERFESSPHIAKIPGARGTLWGAMNAVTEYVDWAWPVRGKSDAAKNESRLNQAWFGDGARLKKKAFDVAVALTN